MDSFGLIYFQESAMNQEPTVADFMDKKFEKLKPDMPLNNAINILVKKGLIAAFVVDDQNKILGILSEKDCLKVILHQAYDQAPWGLVEDYMHPAPEGISSTMPVVEVIDIFVGNRSRRLPVIDAGELVGQITRRDLQRGLHLRLFPREKR